MRALLRPGDLDKCPRIRKCMAGGAVGIEPKMRLRALNASIGNRLFPTAADEVLVRKFPQTDCARQEYYANE
jgi:hypothetical protein